MASLGARLVYDVLMPLLRSKHRYDAAMSLDTLRAARQAVAAFIERHGDSLPVAG